MEYEGVSDRSEMVAAERDVESSEFTLGGCRWNLSIPSKQQTETFGLYLYPIEDFTENHSCECEYVLFVNGIRIRVKFQILNQEKPIAQIINSNGGYAFSNCPLPDSPKLKVEITSTKIFFQK